MNLKRKLIEIRKSIGILQKTEQGNAGARYVDPAVILVKIRERMDELGVILKNEVIDYKTVQIDSPTKNNPLNKGFMCEVGTSYTWIDADSDETMSCPWYAVGSHLQDPSMAFGGSLTYSERYFMLKFFQVPTTKDDPEFLKGKAGVIECINDEQIANIESLITETGTDKERFLNHFCVKSVSEIYASNYNNVVCLLEAKR